VQTPLGGPGNLVREWSAAEYGFFYHHGRFDDENFHGSTARTNLRFGLFCNAENFIAERFSNLNLIDSGASLLFIQVMELRDHPLMTRKSGVKAWPPTWTTRQPNNKQKPRGEIGTLEQALMTEWFNNKIFVFVQYQDFRYMGLIQFDNPEFCYEIFSLLKTQLGRSIKDIGALDLSHTL
jgi:hypothetical protein